MAKEASSSSSRGAWGPVVGCLVVLVMAAVMAWRPLNADDDFWAHAAVGRWMWDHRQWPTQGLFLWGSEPTPWVAHSWLCQVVFYGLLQLGGGWRPQGAVSVGTGPLFIVVLTTMVVCTVFALIWRLWARRARPGALAVTAFLFGIFVGALRFHPRPELLTALLFTVLLCYLAEFRGAGPRIWREVGIVALFIVWANWHGAVALGLMMLVIAAGCDAVQYGVDARSRRLLGLTAACIAVTTLNPYGFFQYWHAVLGSSQTATFNVIREWQAPLSVTELTKFWQGGPVPALMYHSLVMLALLLLTLRAWAYNPERRWAGLAWAIVMCGLYFHQRRHMWLAAITCLVVMADNAQFLRLDGMWNTLLRKEAEAQIPAAVRRVWQAVFVGVAFLTCTNPQMLPSPVFGPAVGSNLTDDACNFLEGQFRDVKKPVRLFNDYETSSYLQWRLNGVDEQGRVPSEGRFALYIDLLNAYPDWLTPHYLAILKQGEKGLRELKPQAVILPRSQQEGQMAKSLSISRLWRLAYRGEDASVWLRQP